MPKNRLQAFSGPRPFGGGSKRKLPIPDERTLRDMSLTNLEDLIAKIQTIVKQKRKQDTWSYHRLRVYTELVNLLEGKYAPSLGLVLNSVIINSMTPQELQLIDLGDHDLEMKVHAALKPFRDEQGKLKV